MSSHTTRTTRAFWRATVSAIALNVGDAVEIGSNLPYANVLHFGGESESAPITAQVQARLWEWMKKTRGQAQSAEEMAERLRALTLATRGEVK